MQRAREIRGGNSESILEEVEEEVGREARRILPREFTYHPLLPFPAQVALVGQEPVLFSGSVRDNIAYGLKGCSDEQVMAAARAARADEFINEMEHGLHTGTCQSRNELIPGRGLCPCNSMCAVPSPFPWLPLSPSPTPGALQGLLAGVYPVPTSPRAILFVRVGILSALVPACVEGVVMVTCV